MALLVQAIRHRIHRKPDEPQPLIERRLANSSLSTRRYSMVEKPVNAMTEHQRRVDNELTASVAKTIRLNERKLLLLEQEEEQLKVTNVQLRQQITDLTHALEAKWILRGERVAKAISDLFAKFQTLDQDLTAKHKEAEKVWAIEMQCLTPNKKDWDYNALQQRLGPDNAYRRGAASETTKWYHIYAGTYTIKYYATSLEELNRTFSDTFPTAVRGKIQAIREEALSYKAASQSAKEEDQSNEVVASPHSLTLAESRVALLQPALDANGVLCKEVQEQMTAQEALQSSNLQLQEENVHLEKKKEEIANMEPRFPEYFRGKLCHQVFGIDGYRDRIKSLLWHCKHDTETYSKHLASLDPWMQQHSCAGASYKTGLALAAQISSAANAMDQLLQKIAQGCPLPAPTT